jgi:uncharacterized protein
MSVEMAFKILDYVFKNVQLHDNFHIFFWGGEPFLNFKVIKAVIEKYPQFRFHTNTNGGTINKEICEFISEHRNIGVTWSFGNCYERYAGPKDKVEHEPWALKMIQDNFQHNVNFMVTKYESLLDDFEYLVTNVTRHVSLDIATKYNHTEVDLDVFFRQYDSLLERYENDPTLYQAINPTLHSNLYYREFGFKSQVQDFHFCRSGLERLFIDMDGGIWQCDNMYVCQHNKLGTIDTGLDYSKLDFMREVDENREKYLGKYCKDCELYKQCSRNMCLGLNLEWMHDMFKPEPSFCKMCKVLYKITKKYVDIEKQHKEAVCQVL